MGLRHRLPALPDHLHHHRGGFRGLGFWEIGFSKRFVEGGERWQWDYATDYLHFLLPPITIVVGFEA